MNRPIEDFVDRAQLLRGVSGDARVILDLLTPGRIVNVITMECALDPSLHRHPPDLEDGEAESYRGGRADLERWKARQPLAEQRARAALATLMMLGLVEEERETDRFEVDRRASARNFYFKRTTWR